MRFELTRRCRRPGGAVRAAKKYLGSALSTPKHAPAGCFGLPVFWLLLFASQAFATLVLHNWASAGICWSHGSLHAMVGFCFWMSAWAMSCVISTTFYTFSFGDASFHGWTAGRGVSSAQSGRSTHLVAFAVVVSLPPYLSSIITASSVAPE